MADFIVKMEGTFLVKKVILIIINLILVVTLSGCSTAESEPAGTNNTNDKTQLITENIPDYTDKIYVEVNGNKAEFSDEDKKRTDAFDAGGPCCPLSDALRSRDQCLHVPVDVDFVLTRTMYSIKNNGEQ